MDPLLNSNEVVNAEFFLEEGLNEETSSFSFQLFSELIEQLFLEDEITLITDIGHVTSQRDKIEKPEGAAVQSSFEVERLCDTKILESSKIVAQSSKVSPIICGESNKKMGVKKEKKDNNSPDSENITCDNDNGSVDLNVGTKNDENEELEQEYVVEKILGKRYNRRQKRIEYLIKWAGYDSESENTWEPSENCQTAPEAIREFEESQKKKRQLRRNKGEENDSKNIEEEKKLSSKSSKKKDQGIETESVSEESRSDINKYESKRARIDRVLGVKKSNNEILALVRFDDGHHDLVRTQEIVEICPKKLVDYYEKSLQFVSS